MPTCTTCINRTSSWYNQLLFWGVVYYVSQICNYYVATASTFHAKQRYWNQAWAWVFSCKFDEYFQGTFFLRTSLESCFRHYNTSYYLNLIMLCRNNLRYYTETKFWPLAKKKKEKEKAGQKDRRNFSPTRKNLLFHEKKISTHKKQIRPTRKDIWP